MTTTTFKDFIAVVCYAKNAKGKPVVVQREGEWLYPSFKEAEDPSQQILKDNLHITEIVLRNCITGHEQIIDRPKKDVLKP